MQLLQDLLVHNIGAKVHREYMVPLPPPFPLFYEVMRYEGGVVLMPQPYYQASVGAERACLLPLWGPAWWWRLRMFPTSSQR